MWRDRGLLLTMLLAIGVGKLIFTSKCGDFRGCEKTPERIGLIGERLGELSVVDIGEKGTSWSRLLVLSGEKLKRTEFPLGEKFEYEFGEMLLLVGAGEADIDIGPKSGELE